jgi:putative transport protein
MTAVLASRQLGPPRGPVSPRPAASPRGPVSPRPATSTAPRSAPAGHGCRRFLVVIAAATAILLAVLPPAIGAEPAAAPAVEAAPFSPWQVVSQVLDEPLVLCFLVIAVGMGIGSIRIAGMSLGTSGVLFAALLFGYFGQHESWAMPEFSGTLGMVLFVYAVGLGAGPTFFRTFREQGRQLAFLGVITVACGASVAWLMTRAIGIPSDLAAGIFAGAMTSSPALAAGLQAAHEAGRQSLAVSIGYGMAYPIGLIAVVLFVQLLPRLLRINLEVMGRELLLQTKSRQRIGRFLIKIRNPAVFGKSLHDLPLLDKFGWQITRVLDGNRLIPIKPDHVFENGQVILLVTDERNVDLLAIMLGERTEQSVVIDSDHDRADVVVTSPDMLNRSLRDLRLHGRFGVTIARIERYGVTFVPNGNTALSMADRITAVGEPAGLKAFEQAAGHRIRRLHETDLMSVGLGLVFGIVLGMVPVYVPGVGEFRLGLAGGPLLAGLLFAHFGRLMGIVGYMPLAARMLTQELGLALFLAAAGYHAGGQSVEMLRQYGAMPLVMSLVVATVSLTVSALSGRYLLRMNWMQVLGGTCGAMTSTAGIGAIVNKTDCDIPVTSYAAAYPAALVLMTVLTQILVALLD